MIEAEVTIYKTFDVTNATVDSGKKRKYLYYILIDQIRYNKGPILISCIIASAPDTNDFHSSVSQLSVTTKSAATSLQKMHINSLVLNLVIVRHC